MTRHWYLFIWMIFFSLVSPFVYVGPLHAQGFRQLGEGFLEAVVMESDAIIEVEVVTTNSVRVVEVLKDVNVLGGQVAKGLLIEGTTIEPYSFPLFSDSSDDAKYIADQKLSSGALYPSRTLLFAQQNKAQTSRRFHLQSYPAPSDSPCVVREGGCKPVPVEVYSLFGKQGFYFYGLVTETHGHEQSGSPAVYLVKDFEKVKTSLTKLKVEFDQVFEEGVNEQLSTSRFPLRRFTPPADAHTWPNLLNRIKRAISRSRQFYQARENMSGNEKEDFYFKTLFEENIYSNYAIESLRQLDRREVSQRMLESIPRLNIFVDDVLEGVLWREIAKNGQTENLLRTAVSTKTRDPCFKPERVSPSTESKVFISSPPLTQRDSFLFSPFEELLPSFVALYEAELRCYLQTHNISQETLTINYKKKIGSHGLALLRSGALTMDEVGLLESPINIYLEQVKKQEEVLKEFSPQLSKPLFDTLSVLPARLREQARFCLQGIKEDKELGHPDLRKGSFLLWEWSCRNLSLFEPSHTECKLKDNRLESDIVLYQSTMKQGLLQAMEQDNERMLTLFLDILRSKPVKNTLSIISAVIEDSKTYGADSIRVEFLRQVTNWPYYSVALILAEEYEKANKEQQQVLDPVLEEITGEKIVSSSAQSKWTEYLQRIKQGLNDRDPVLGAPERVRKLLKEEPCNEKEIGWNRHLRKVAEDVHL